MSSDERFIELWNDHLEDELDETDAAELRATSCPRRSSGAIGGR